MSTDGQIRRYPYAVKHQLLKNIVLCQNKIESAFGLPKFKMHYISFILRHLENWFSSEHNLPWPLTERSLVRPYKLNQVLFCSLSHKQCKWKFGPIISHSIQIWLWVVKMGDIDVNGIQLQQGVKNNLLCPKREHFPTWAKSAIQTLSLLFLYDNKGLRWFEDFRKNYNLPLSLPYHFSFVYNWGQSYKPMGFHVIFLFSNIHL